MITRGQLDFHTGSDVHRRCQPRGAARAFTTSSPGDGHAIGDPGHGEIRPRDIVGPPPKDYME